jgi:type IV pilus assembly protein PilX
MSAHMTRSNLRLRSRQQGMALITGLLLLVVCTLIAVSMFRSYGMQEKIAGNIREKQRATNAANSTLQYAEWWLTNNALPSPVTCSGAASATVQICSNALTDPTNVPWSNGGVTFTGFNTSNTVTTSASRGTYYATPVFYITDLGANSGTPAGEVYQIDAVAWGSTPNTVAVVESTYLLTTGSGGGGGGGSLN